MHNKKILLIFSLFSLLFTEVKAQIPGLTLGIKAGYLQSIKNEHSRARPGGLDYEIGTFARFGSLTYLQPEINFEKHSYTYPIYSENSYGSTYDSFKESFFRLNVPVLIGHKFFATPLFALRGYLGPDLSIKISQPKSKLTYLQDTYGYRDKFNNYAMGGVIGMGADIGSFTFDARINIGITDIEAQDPLRLNSFGIAFGFKFL